MPELSRFLGIVVFMVYDDHQPPHFHARYGEFVISVEILTGKVEGRFPKRALAAALEWADLHRAELVDDWERAARHDVLRPIEPLE
jgi:hypothetical protein